jgi:hypothetical protein
MTAHFLVTESVTVFGNKRHSYLNRIVHAMKMYKYLRFNFQIALKLTFRTQK